MVETAADGGWKDAQAFRAARPTTLRMAEPRERCPLISLAGVDADIVLEQLLVLLHK